MRALVSTNLVYDRNEEYETLAKNTEPRRGSIMLASRCRATLLQYSSAFFKKYTLVRLGTEPYVQY